MTAALFVVVAAAASVFRAVVTAGQARGHMPWRTMAINVGGAFLLGALLAWEAFTNPVVVSAAGFGSLTTFSTVAAEVAALLDDGRKRLAIAYVGMSLAGGVAAAWVGLIIGEWL